MLRLYYHVGFPDLLRPDASPHGIVQVDKGKSLSPVLLSLSGLATSLSSTTHSSSMAENRPTSSSGDATSVVSPTIASFLALTTPFVQPATECASIWEPETVRTFGNGTSLTLTVLASDAADPQFTSCQPSGWATNLPAHKFSYSPAVCPSGWTYWGMEGTTKIDDKASAADVFTSALCCDRYVCFYQIHYCKTIAN